MKQAMTFSTAVGLGILLIVAFFSTIAFEGFFAFGEKATEKAECELSIREQGSSEKCPVHHVVMSPTTTTVIKKGEPEQKTGIPKDNHMQHSMGMMLRDCSQKGGGPNSKAFDRDLLFDKNMCLICNTFHTSEALGGLNDFLRVQKPPRSTKTYFEHITGDVDHQSAHMAFGKHAKYDFFPSIRAFDVKPGVEYTVLFYGIKDDHIGSFFDTASDIMSLKFFSAAVQNKDDVYFTFIVETSQIDEELCGTYVN